MSSYFEISGEIIECLYDTSLSSSQPSVFVAERPERGRIPQKASGPQRGRGKAEEPESRDTLFEHWKKTSFHNVDRLSQLTRREQIGLIKRPYVFALWGVQGALEVIQMHLDYVKS
jgi:hypothetical protein